MPSLIALGIDVYGFEAVVKCMACINDNGGVGRADMLEALDPRIRGTLSIVSCRMSGREG
jgi:hypothetical protein